MGMTKCTRCHELIPEGMTLCTQCRRDAELIRLREQVKFTYCAYCGEKFPADGTDSVSAVSAHIQNCAKHPMRNLEAEVERLKAHNEIVARQVAIHVQQKSELVAANATLKAKLQEVEGFKTNFLNWLAAYKLATQALPAQVEDKAKGSCVYNWRRSFIREVENFLASIEKETEND